MTLPLKRTSQVHSIITLRFFTIALQLVLIGFVNLGLAYDLPWLPLLAVIAVEVVFTLGSFSYYKKPSIEKNATGSVRQATLSRSFNDKSSADSGADLAANFNADFRNGTGDNIALLGQICADVIFLSLLLYFSGGATNAFVSLLLIPIAIAAVTLPSVFIILVAGLAILFYSILLWLMPMSVMHGNMEGHFIGMWVNFLFSACVVALVVGKMARTINQRELAIASYRENLLKQEKIISLGVASAQVTHQLATPIATIQLLADELIEDFPENPAVIDMQKELERCKESLHAFRQLSFAHKEEVVSLKLCMDIVGEIQDYIALNAPDVTLNFAKSSAKLNLNNSNNSNELDSATIFTDASLMPAILNLINNAVRATKANGSDVIELTHHIIDNSWQMIIRDFGLGFKLSTLNELGVNPVDSEHGLGMAVFLSHASLERLGGTLLLTNHNEGGAMVTLSLPLSGGKKTT